MSESESENDVPREAVLKVLRGLMVAEDLGDVHDEIIELWKALGLEGYEYGDGPEGDFLDGWTERDWKQVGRP